MQNDEILKAEFEKTLSECERIRKENARLRTHLGKTPYKLDSGTGQSSAYNNSNPQLLAIFTANSPSELKVSLFRSLFRGRDDVYAVRWEGRGGRTGYSPAGVREWEQAPSVGSRQKRSFHHSKLFPLTEEVIRDHLLGRLTIGVYALVQEAQAHLKFATIERTAVQVLIAFEEARGCRVESVSAEPVLSISNKL